MLPFADRLEAGRAFPMGATWDGLGVNFAVFSGSATGIDLCIFDASGRRQIACLPLPECTDEVWHGYLPGAGEGLVYGYRAHGPYAPQHGHRFNHHKLLLDPYARRLTGDVKWSDSLFGYRLQSHRADLSFDRRDSAAGMPKAVVTALDPQWPDDRSPGHAWNDTVVYEMHLRGASMLRTDLLPNERGTFAAFRNPYFIEHLKRLGVTAVELLPIQAFLQDRHLIERGLRNYWGYNTLNFFAPEPAYLSTNSLNELRSAIRRLHAADIEVILDVVYNHTCEGNQLGPTLSFRGLDNASYYRLVPGNERYFIDETGCGNTLNLSHPRVLQMVMDSLRYWCTTFNVDGFRFDLGVTLGREGTGFDPGSGFFDAILQDPLLSTKKLISEPWDVGLGGYQLGGHPPGFAEWNDKYRDCVRQFWRGDEGVLGELAARLAGSADVFNHRHRKPYASVNFVAAHDGFTLADVVSYAEKHNDANGEGNADGHNHNISANYGEEGPTDRADVLDARARVMRAMLGTVLLSQGTPMIPAGDEFGRTQGGNNNAYCQDNEISWIDWNLAERPEGDALIAFVARLTELRRTFPVLRSWNYLHGEREVVPGVAEMAWFGQDGGPMMPESWADGRRAMALLRAGPAAERGAVDITLTLFNAGTDAADFTLPEPRNGWRLLLDSARPEQADIDIADRTSVQGRSLQFLVRRVELPA